MNSVAKALPTAALFALLLFAPLSGQTGTVTGTVRDRETGAGIPDAAVQVLGGAGAGAGGVFTDSDGGFRLTLPVGTYSLVLSNLGYETRRLDGIEIRAGETREVDVELASQALTLNPVVVTASRREEKALEAPAAVATISSEEIQREVALTPVENVKGVEGVDVAQTGVMQNNVVTRGFNNVFSGALLVLTDNRYAYVPSLRFNAYDMIPVPNLDVERVELVLGPGSALYGPNAASGVMHIITSSPIDVPGTSVSLGPGVRGGNPVDNSAGALYQVAFRQANRFSEAFGLKVSGQWFRGDDWQYVDPVEQAARAAEMQKPPAEQNPRVGNRLPTAERWGGEIRGDWRPWDDGEVIVNGGINQVVSAVELTGQGAGEARNWTYSYVQSRLRKGRLFAQAYVNMSDAGNTYLLRTGQHIVDRSRMWVGQIQHGFDLGTAQTFTYGLDVQKTIPRTGGTITGENENNDNITEVGGYVQSETSLTDRVDLVAALRVDYHSRLPDPNVSPRAAVVFHPSPEQNFRITFNRAFSTPTTNNLFLDIVAGSIGVPPASPLFSYNVRTHGVPENGYSFDDTCPGGILDLCMRSPLGPGQLPATAIPFWNGVVQSAAQAGIVPQAVATMLLDPGSQPGDPALGSVLRRFNQAAAQTGATNPDVLFPLDPSGPRAIDPITSTITNTLEVGYKGLLADRLLLSVNVYRSSIKDFIGPLRVETPNVFFDPEATSAYVQKRLAPLVGAGVVGPEEVQAIVAGLAGVPVGTVVPDQRTSPDLILTYRNFGDVSLWGSDVGARLIATPRISFDGSFSWVSRECVDFNHDGNCQSAADVSLNAPKVKGSLGARYENQLWGLTVEGRGRFTRGFVMNSGVYIGQVDGYSVFDATVGYRLASVPGATVTLAVNNVFNDLHREFIGAPELGRLAMLRLRYDF